MNIRQAWLALRTDPDWRKKLALTAAINLIPYVGPFLVMGYGLSYARATAWGTYGERLPEWQPWADHGRQGLGAFAVSFVYSLPLLALYLLAEIPVMIVWFLAFASHPDGPPPIGAMVAMLAVPFGFLALSMAYVPVSYSGLLEFAMQGRIDAAWRFRDVWARMRANLLPLSRLAVRVVALGLGVLVAVFGVPAAVLILAVWGLGSSRESAVLLVFIVPLAYLLMFVAAGVLGAVTQLITYRMLGAYAREAYGLSAPPAEAA